MVDVDARSSSEHFDHVLLDMNQILHVVMRRSRNEDHAIRLLMSELDRILEVVTPNQSLVLAIDGPPAAAKLATQRRRRYGTLVRTEWKLKHFDKLRIPKRQRAKKLRGYHSELNSLQITPATEWMQVMEATLLYWAWQRMQQRYSKLRKVKVYLSPSTVPGEGEVKLLEWVLQKPRQGQSLAILGRDSDLLLEGLVIPPSWTHNVYVIRQEGPNDYLSVSLWETTRTLLRWLPPDAPPQAILQLRTDLVLLMILNGNDYLPKLRGSRGFSNICQTYRTLLGEFPNQGLIHPDTLELQLGFCIRFFGAIAKAAPQEAWVQPDSATNDRKTPLGELNNIMDGGFVPRPKRFRVLKGVKREGGEFDGNDDDEDDEGMTNDALNDEGDDIDEDLDEDDSDDDVSSTKLDSGEDDDNEEEHDKILVQLTLGDPEGNDFLQYEVWHDQDESFKGAKQKLAAMALDEFHGIDYNDSSDTFDFEMAITNSGYPWEILSAVEGKVDRYLEGLLWNLQTYQDGICPDYNYNYGRRMSPTAMDIVEFLKEAKAENRTVGRRDLLNDKFAAPVSAGLACLAALPSQVKHLIPEPYRWLPDETVEAFYEQCMDPTDNAFDMKRFETICEAEIAEIRKQRETDENDDQAHGRRILTGDHYWTVISRTTEPLTHPFDPPPPPSDKLSELYSNNRIRVSRTFVLDAPRPRSVWGDPPHRKRKPHGVANNELVHSDWGNFLKGKDSLLDVNYKIGYRKEYDRMMKKRKSPSKVKFQSVKVEVKSPVLKEADVSSRMQKFNITMPPKDPQVNLDGDTAMVCLSQLSDVHIIGSVKFTMTTPSKSDYASFNPKNYEHLQLTVERSEKEHKNVLVKNLKYDQDRDMKHQSRQALRQHIAAMALCDITGPEHHWSEMTLVDLRRFLQQKTNIHGDMASLAENGKGVDIRERMKQFKKVPPPNNPVSSKGGQTAMACLKQLVDAGLIGDMKYTYTKPSTSEYASFNPSNYEHIRLFVQRGQYENTSVLQLDLEYDQDRDVNNQTRQVLKQHLASLALRDITGPQRRWSDMNNLELKAFLKKNSKSSSVQPPTV
jgi:hypothetical protein